MIQHSVFLQGKFTLQDMRSFFFYWLQKYALLYFIFIFLLFVWVFSVDERLPITVYHSETLELLLNGLLIIVLSMILTLLLIGFFYIRMQIGFRKNERLKRKRTYTINPQGIQIQSKNSDTLFQWHEVTAVTEYKRLFLMKTSSSQLILIPKRYFTFENELHSFRQLVTEYGQAKKVKWQS
ncbi:YcxB family protein [Bacillus sonorensis]|uniref:YcxB-like C-terminal domain-containing protein n=3 Tax=Bacillus sonorensis TaxID=119858 RepID=M5P1A0_9BACI|nr:YcxB family protein [Bacillus sonorensis]EME73203.1 hypothetical protein BSONL12_15804 [Bacillus sonorensis L12]NWN78073.1 YcxB family protein [Bacillus sp. (in: firmicutes)]TWK79479.1 hypothetical protein CHCC20335_0256 [Bacillus paralicheniformis]MBG9914198.1 hypothetical protein [Bacillus sonorensis]MCF7616558.1 YcxB family protein [Bacillus sonorensis]